MVDRIERINRTKQIAGSREYDFSRKEGYDDEKNDGEGFEEEMTSAEKRRAAREKQREEQEHNPMVTEHYKLELNRATQSLFYKKGTRIKVGGKDITGD